VSFRKQDTEENVWERAAEQNFKNGVLREILRNRALEIMCEKKVLRKIFEKSAVEGAGA
jgi:hypothetical protein